MLKLSRFDFLKVVPNRKAKIDAAKPNELPKLDSYVPNKIANALHPDFQYVKVSNIKELSKDVKTFTFVPNKEKGTENLAYFSAGQYLSVNLEINGMKISRAYSISSSPKDSLNNIYKLTIKRVDGGLATNYILDNWTVGTEVKISAPEGDFTFEPLRDSENIIGLAGGSGITPFLSLANAIADGDEDCNLTLLYGSRTEADILFKDEFDALQAKCNKIKIVHVLSGENKEGYEQGFITADLIKKYAGNKEYSIFICGPQVMYEFVDKEIEKLGLRQKFIRHELFGEYHNPERNADYPKDIPAKVKITVIMRGEETVIEANANDTILASIEKAGIAAPSRCRSGICGYCHSRLVSGSVYVPKSVDGRRLADFDYGYIHPCVTFPTSDVVIDVPPVK